VGEESRAAVVALNQAVRSRGAASSHLTNGVWRLLQGYEGELAGLLQRALPGGFPPPYGRVRRGCGTGEEG
jgi:hypothetical protein